MSIFNFKSWRLQSQQASSGFLLLETAIALYMVVCLTSMMALLCGQAFGHFTHAHERVRAMRFARATLERLLYSGALKVGKQIIRDSAGLTVEITAFPDALYAHFVHIDVKVSWKTGSHLLYTGAYQ